MPTHDEEATYTVQMPTHDEEATYTVQMRRRGITRPHARPHTTWGLATGQSPFRIFFSPHESSRSPLQETQSGHR
jgi:hypothetical protein